MKQLKTRTEQILATMPILAWVAFTAYVIETGAVLYSYTISFVDPEAAKDVYRGLNLYRLSKINFWYYTQAISLVAGLAVSKAVVAWLVIRALTKFRLENPFTMDMVVRLEKISYAAFGTWILAMVSNGHLAWMMKETGELQGNWISGEFIFIIALVYVMSQIFRRGVEIQTENELTV